MQFNSLSYFVFLPIVFSLYWLVNTKRSYQNTVLLISSYIFYSWWDWRFLSLIFLSTLVDYYSGLNIYYNDCRKSKKLYLWISLLFNVVLLGFFKYFNFFIDSWIDLLFSFGYHYKSTWSLNIILPVGISFYTFQTMSYSIDIYKGNLKPTKDFVSFASFVSFFPQLVAGPIERASNLIPQIIKNREFNYRQGVQGLRLILWGMFKKVVVADSLAWRVDLVFNNYQNYDGGVLLLSLIYFSFQIYCDFSGYSDIAIGTAKLFGFELMSNFKFPYFSRNIGEFWRRWHISLSTWFRDYLYIPLGGSNGSKWLTIRNIFIIFIISGFWHGAEWKFIIWGLIHAFLYIPLFLVGKNRSYNKSIVAKNSWLPSLNELLNMGITYFLILIAWVFFRSENVNHALVYLQHMIENFGLPEDSRGGLFFTGILVFVDWIIKNDERNPFKIQNTFLRWLTYIMCSFSIYYFWTDDKNIFIYFQF